MKTHPPIYSHNPHQAEAFPLLVLDVARQVCTPSNEGFRVLHWHEEIQFIFVRQGIIHARIYDEELDVGAGDCLFINRCVPHKTTEVVDCRYHSYIIPERMLSFFPGSLMEQEEVNALLYHPGFTFFLLRQDNPAHHLPLQKIRQMDALYFTRKPPRHFHYRLNIALVTFWLEFICVLPSLPPAVEPKDHQRIQKLLTYIHHHYAQDLTVEQIAAAANISKTECLRCFRKYAGDSPYQYLIKYRLHISASLLKNTKTPVTVIATSVGFSSASSYIRYFRKYYGCTPKIYRQNAEQNNE